MKAKDRRQIKEFASILLSVGVFGTIFYVAMKALGWILVGAGGIILCLIKGYY